MGRWVVCLITAAFLGSVSLVTPQQAIARERLYLELGAGVSFLMNASGLFGRSTATLPQFGLGAKTTFGFVVMPQQSWFAFHIGAEYRYATSWDSGLQLSLHSLYPILRLEAAKRFFITLGASPFMFTRDAAGYGFDALTWQTGAVGFLVDLGYNFRLTPAVSIIFCVGAQTAFSNGTFSPLPSLEGSGLLRFWIDAGDGFMTVEEEKKARGFKYDGYRYPYGREKK
jgi:hypothetical protein